MKFFDFINLKNAKLLPIAIAFLLLIVNIDAAPYQELEARKGWIPVYIRYGDTPLSEINPNLADAFKERESKAVPKIESDSLILENDATADTTAETTNPTETKNSDKSVENASELSTSEPKDSDIASFDVIKGIEKKEV